MDLVQQSCRGLSQENGEEMSNGHGNGPMSNNKQIGNGMMNGFNNYVNTNGFPPKSSASTNGGGGFATSNGIDVDDALSKIPRYEKLIGNTPMVDLTSLCSPRVSGVRIFGKCEFLNPGFSMKDRIVKNILDKAEQSGELKPGGTVVAASSGNTGAAVAMVCAMRGYKAVITTSTKCSLEKMDTIKAYGAKLLVSPPGVPEAHPESYMNMARTLAAENEGWFDVNQYDNLDNPEGHYRTLGPEIWEQTGGAVTHFVAGGSTGGTISGTGKYLKAQNPDIQCILADPIGSSFYGHYLKRKQALNGATNAERKPFLVEGVGKDSVPGCLNFDIVDDLIRVKDSDSFKMCHELARTEGLMVGGSAGLNTFAALQLANTVETPAVIVTVLCDLGIKYLSKVYNDKWLETNHININE